MTSANRDDDVTLTFNDETWRVSEQVAFANKAIERAISSGTTTREYTLTSISSPWATLYTKDALQFIIDHTKLFLAEPDKDHIAHFHGMSPKDVGQVIKSAEVLENDRVNRDAYTYLYEQAQAEFDTLGQWKQQ